MTARRALAAVVAAAAIAMTACTVTFGSPPTASPPRTPDASPSPAPTGPSSAAAAMKALCEAPKAGGGSSVTPEGPTPPAIATVEQQVESVRGLRFTSHVDVQAITQGQMDRRLTRSFDKTEPVDQLARRSQAWSTIGVIPAGTSIRDALLKFQTGQVVGFYNPENKKLVYLGDEVLSQDERFILAHELTHAIDDQHFGLARIDPIAAACDDEAFQAALGAVEGSAQFFATQVLMRFPEVDTGPGTSGGGTLEGVPPFIVNQELWPYTAGLAFIERLDEEGGTTEVNRALTTFPVSTEQIMHPERWPNDTPQPLDIPDLGPSLGNGWMDLDVMETGELWLQQLLQLRLGQSRADQAAAGWDGGLYRAWGNGSRTAIVLRTVWDTPTDAQGFADAMTTWGQGQDASVGAPDGTHVDVLFASDPATLAALEGASG